MRLVALTSCLALLASVMGACSQAEIAGIDVRADPGVQGADGELPQGEVQASGLPGIENFVITAGAPVANDETGATLGLKPGIKAQGASISFASSKPIPSETFEKAQFVIPFTGDASDKLVVMFRLIPEGKDAPINGVIPNTYLDIDAAKKTVAFKPRGLGEYQAAWSSERIIKPFTSVSPKTGPVIVPILEVLGKINYANFFGIDASGDTVYLIGNTGLRAVSIANPAVPAQIGLLSNAGVFGDGRGIRLSGNLLVQTTNEGGYGVFNVPTPTAPTFRGGIGDAQGRDITIVGQRAFGATSQGMRVFQFQTALTLEVLASQTGGCYGVEGDATLVVFACGQTVMGIVPNTLPNLNTVQLDATLGGRGVAMADAYAYVAGDDGLRIYDVLNPTQPRKVATLAIPGALQVAVRGGLAIVLTATQAIAVDVRNKLAPVLIQGQESTLPISMGRRVKFLSPDRALILDSTGLSVLSVHPVMSAVTMP